MNVQIDKNSSVPMYRQIVNQIRNQIISGSLSAGYVLPPERKLAGQLGVNRTTVLNAYRELKAENLIGSHVGKGTIVQPITDELIQAAPYSPGKPVWSHFYSDYSSQFDGYSISSIRELAGSNYQISFAAGTPNDSLLPSDLLKAINSELFNHKPGTGELLSPVEGYDELRQSIATYMCSKGTGCTPAEVMILSGSQQGIDLAARLFINPGDYIVVEEPSYFPALESFKTAGARLVGIPMDRDGMRTELLEEMLKRYRPKIIYTIPSYHNPSGATLSLPRRKELLEIAIRYNTLIIEDDAYGELCYDGQPLPTLKSMENIGYVIYISTFSKSVSPGLQTGWMITSKEVVGKISGLRQMIDLQTSATSQKLCNQLLLSSRLEQHISERIKQYKERRDLAVAALERYAPDGLQWNPPAGGYYLWCRLPDGVSARKLLEETKPEQVVFMPGNIFFLSSREDRYIRLNFVYPAKEDIDRGIKIICDKIRGLISSQFESSK